ncbi:hypothetical protein JW916_07080 [Candidatus Sumerlaeota bacterium]|nr:hypothetical protein [Candidatus Sumerlaeota bacterium]
MKVREAKQAACKWIEENAASYPGYKGAIIAGSANAMDPEAEWPATSDVDLWLMVENPKATPRQKKILFEGVIVEAVPTRLAHFDDPEEVLGDPYKAHHFAVNNILSDPTGILSDVQKAVGPKFAEPKWVLERLRGANGSARHKLTKVAEDPQVGRMMDFVLGIRNTAAQCPLAKLRSPTFRKCLVVAREILNSMGREDLYDELLDVLGTRHFSRSDAEALRDATMPMFDRAVAVLKTPFWPDFEFAECVRPIAIGGITELIESGFHRESVWFALFIQTASMKAIKNDAPEDEKARFADQFMETLSAIGLTTPDDLAPRARRGLDALDKIHAAMSNEVNAS